MFKGKTCCDILLGTVHTESIDNKGLFGTAPTPAPPLLKLEFSQTVSAPPKLGVELGGALSQNVLELWS